MLNDGKLSAWWTSETGGEMEGPYTVHWLADGTTRTKHFRDEDEASEWGHANLGERVDKRPSK